MKVLWFSNCAIADVQCTGSGSWLFGMRDIISSQVELYNITEARGKAIQFVEDLKVKEYRIPVASLSNQDIPPASTIQSIKRIVNSVAPDVIHIWGLEKYWAKLFAYGYITGNVLLEIQGVLSACAHAFWGGLTPDECKKSHSLKELVKPSTSLTAQYENYIRRGNQEIELLQKFKHISTQSEWTRKQITPYLGKNVTVYNALRPIREEFYLAPKWKPQNHTNPVIFSSLGYSVPFKGFHILLKAFRLVVGKYSKAKLVIAGIEDKLPLYRINGYDRFLFNFIYENGLQHNIVLTGKVNARQIINSLLSSDLYVNPTFIESYSAATAEALFLGVPSVLSYAGALPYFSEKDGAALYYSPMDYVDCASKIIDVFENSELHNHLSEQAMKALIIKSSPRIVANNQMNIYASFLSAATRGVD